jgi:hypothetical protein
LAPSEAENLCSKGTWYVFVEHKIHATDMMKENDATRIIWVTNVIA